MFKDLCITFLFAVLVKSAQSGPLHASCRVKWNWSSVSCADVQAKIVDQINKWNGTDCGDGEKCLYELKSRSEMEVTATHTTPVHHYVDDLSFKFNPTPTSCQVEGYSRSETWYAILDYGTNYCNMENLITGAGLDKMPGYTEKTDDSICTQYSSANCEKY